MTDRPTIGLMNEEHIVLQLAHVASLRGMTGDTLERLDYSGTRAHLTDWTTIALLSLGLDYAAIRARVIAAVRAQEST